MPGESTVESSAAGVASCAGSVASFPASSVQCSQCADEENWSRPESEAQCASMSAVAAAAAPFARRLRPIQAHLATRAPPAPGGAYARTAPVHSFALDLYSDTAGVPQRTRVSSEGDD